MNWLQWLAEDEIEDTHEIEIEDTHRRKSSDGNRGEIEIEDTHRRKSSDGNRGGNRGHPSKPAGVNPEVNISVFRAEIRSKSMGVLNLLLNLLRNKVEIDGCPQLDVSPQLAQK